MLFESNAMDHKKLHFVPELLREIMATEDKGNLQRVLDATVRVMGEETALFVLARIFVTSGHQKAARKMLQQAGLRYRKSTIERNCQKLKELPTALEDAQIQTVSDHGLEPSLSHF